MALLRHVLFVSLHLYVYDYKLEGSVQTISMVTARKTKSRHSIPCDKKERASGLFTKHSNYCKEHGYSNVKINNMIYVSGVNQVIAIGLLTLCAPSFHTKPPNSGIVCLVFVVKMIL